MINAKIGDEPMDATERKIHFRDFQLSCKVVVA